MKNKLRLCYLANAKSIHVKRWLEYFVQKGYDVHLFSDEYEDIKGVKVYDMKKALTITRRIKGTGFLLMVRKFRRLIKDIAPDIIHIKCVTHYGFWATLSGFHPFVLTPWGTDLLVDPQRSFERKIKAMLSLKFADCITSNSERLRQAAIRLGANPKKTFLIHWGIDLTKFRPGLDGTSIRKRLNLGNSPVVISTRPLMSNYNLDIIVRSISIVKKEIPEANYLFLGRGECIDELKKSARNLKVRESIRFLCFIPNDELPYYYAASDVFISIPTSDSDPLSLSEAMACGIPVIAGELKTPNERIKDGYNGLIVPHRDPETLASATIKILKDNEMAERFASINIEQAKRLDDREKTLGLIDEIYHLLLEGETLYGNIVDQSGESNI